MAIENGATNNDELVQTIKVKIYAGKEKTQSLRQSLGNVRFVWNRLLAMNMALYAREKKFLFRYDMSKEIPKLREEYPFLQVTPAQSFQQVAKQLDISLRKFLKRKEDGFPTFMKKGKGREMLVFPQFFKNDGNYLRLSKIGWVKIRDKLIGTPEWENIVATAKQVSIKEEPDGFFAYIVYTDSPKPLPPTGTAVGIDLGIKTTIYTSNEERISLPMEEIKKTVDKIEHLQSIIDNKKNINKERGIRHSKRVDDLKRKQMRLYKHLREIKHDFYYKSVNSIFKSHECVVVEDLQLDKLVQVKSESKGKDRKIHKSLSNISLSDFYRILDWKAEQYRRTVIRVNPAHTSKTCSVCGYINHDLKLSDRTYKCPSCGAVIDRDYNASINILNRGLEIIRKSSSDGLSEYMRDAAGGVPQ